MKLLRLSALLCALTLGFGTLPAQAAITGKKPITNKQSLQGIPGPTCKPSEVATIVDCTWPRYALNFSVSNVMTVTEGADRHSLFIFGSQSDVLMTKDIPTFAIVMTVKDLPTLRTLEQLDKEFRANATYNNTGDDASYYSEFHLNDVVPTTLMGLPGNKYTFTAEAQNMKFNYIVYRLLQGQREYEVLFRTTPELHEQNRTIFEAIAAGITLNSTSLSSSSFSKSSSSSISSKRTVRTQKSSSSKRASASSRRSAAR